MIIDYKRNLFSQIIKNYVKKLSYSILQYDENEIRCFTKGIIAGESCVEINNLYKNFRVHISASQPKEKKLYHDCLKKLRINSYLYPGDKLIISRKENLLKLLKQKLMCLSHKKYNKFLRIKDFYLNYEDLEDWKVRTKLAGPHNKISKETISLIIELHHLNPNWPAWKIAEQVGVSSIKVQRVRKENNLGIQKTKTPEEKRIEIANFTINNPNLRQIDIANQFEVHESVVRRAIKKYNI